MTPLFRDILLFVGAAVLANFLIIGPLIGLMFLTGGAIVAIVGLAGLLVAAFVLDRRNNFSPAGWPGTAVVLGLIADVTYLVLTTEGFS